MRINVGLQGSWNSQWIPNSLQEIAIASRILYAILTYPVLPKNQRISLSLAWSYFLQLWKKLFKSVLSCIKDVAIEVQKASAPTWCLPSCRISHTHPAPLDYSSSQLGTRWACLSGTQWMCLVWWGCPSLQCSAAGSWWAAEASALQDGSSDWPPQWEPHLCRLPSHFPRTGSHSLSSLQSSWRPQDGLL